jgi:glycosyltransferase involved in cell wall biosynthesis
MIKVCHIITKLELGGAQQNTLFTVQHLERQKFLPSLITNPDGILVAETHRFSDVSIFYIPELVREIRPHLDMIAFVRIRTILLRERLMTPDIPIIVHTHSSKAGVVGRWAAKMAGIPNIIHSVHGFGFHPYQPFLTRWIYMALERLTARITNHFIAVSQANIRTGVQAGIFSESHVSLIRSGIDIARFRQMGEQSEAELQRIRERLMRQFQIPPHKKIVGMVACFKPQKSPLDFIRVMRRVANEIPDAHAIMAGDGLLRPQIEALITELGLESTISLIGWRDDIPELMALCQVLVLTSRWEGLPRVCPQAMAVGRPIVATSVDGIPEAVHHGENGFLVSPGQIDEMAQHLIFLLSHPKRVHEMGLAGQRLVDEFDIHRMVTQQEALYERIANG